MHSMKKLGRQNQNKLPAMVAWTDRAHGLRMGYNGGGSAFLPVISEPFLFGQLEIIVGWPVLTAYSPVTSEPLLRISWIL